MTISIKDEFLDSDGLNSLAEICQIENEELITIEILSDDTGRKILQDDQLSDRNTKSEIEFALSQICESRQKEQFKNE